MLSTGAFNALLKTLEEPPPHVKFIFATTEPHKVPGDDPLALPALRLPARPAAQIADAAARRSSRRRRSQLATRRSRSWRARRRAACATRSRSSTRCSPPAGRPPTTPRWPRRSGRSTPRRSPGSRGRSSAATARPCSPSVEGLHARGLEMKRVAEELVRHLRNVVGGRLVPASPIDLPDAELAEVRAQAAAGRPGAAHPALRPRAARGRRREALGAAPLRAGGGAPRGRLPRAGIAGLRAARARGGARERRAASPDRTGARTGSRVGIRSRSSTFARRSRCTRRCVDALRRDRDRDPDPDRDRDRDPDPDPDPDPDRDRDRDPDRDPDRDRDAPRPADPDRQSSRALARRRLGGRAKGARSSPRR